MRWGRDRCRLLGTPIVVVLLGGVLLPRQPLRRVLLIPKGLVLGCLEVPEDRVPGVHDPLTIEPVLPATGR